MPMRVLLAQERAQLLAHWRRLARVAPCWIETPFSQIENLRACPTEGARTRMWLRRFHDRLGWKAKDDLRRGGLCSGAIYRTETFIRLAQDRRCGSRAGRTVHIEHTVPIGTLADAWARHRAEGVGSLARSYAWLLSHSVATAFHDQEETHVAAFRHTTHCFDQESDWYCRPFRRYDGLLNAGGAVWDVFHGRLVDAHELTFASHFGTVLALLTEARANEGFVAQLRQAGAAMGLA